jgi:hypothetical protein
VRTMHTVERIYWQGHNIHCSEGEKYGGDVCQGGIYNNVGGKYNYKWNVYEHYLRCIHVCVFCGFAFKVKVDT